MRSSCTPSAPGTRSSESTLNDPLKAQALRDAASEERLPVVLAGDFGFTDRSAEYRMFDDDVP